MKLCIRCNTTLEDGNNFCQKCGAYQEVRVESPARIESAYFLMALCILTIIGSLFGIVRGWLYEMVSGIDSGGNYYRGWIYMLTNIGTLIAAIFMIKRKLLGLYIYTISQIIYILTVMSATFAYDGIFEGSSAIASGISSLFLIPSITFIIFYWLNMNRKHLS